MQDESLNVWIEKFTALDPNFFYGAIVLILLLTFGLHLHFLNELTNIKSALAEKPPKSGTTPSHVVFSDKLLGVPLLPRMLEGPLWVKNASPGFSRFAVQAGDWVKQGDTLISFVLAHKLLPPFTIIAHIRSPIAGRIIHTSSRIFEKSVDSRTGWEDFLCVIEVPIGEWVPGDMWAAFSEFCDMLWDYRLSVLQKSRDNRVPGYSDEVINDMLAALKSLSPTIISKDVDSYQRINSLNLHQPHGIGSPVNIRLTADHSTL